MGKIAKKTVEVEGDDAWATLAENRKKKKTPRSTRSRSQLNQKHHTKEVESNNSEGPAAVPTARLPTPTPSPTPKPMPGRTLPLLICSIGNPGSTYANTLHSAGHTVLNRLAEYLESPSFHKDRSFGNGLVSKIGDWTLWQSTSYMNESGRGVRAAWQVWSKTIPDGEGRLVVVHDELEKPLGAVTLKTTEGASAKGHNGVKSIMSFMGNTPFARIGIGIGRPASRDSDDVAQYVLKKMALPGKAKIEDSLDEVVEKLKQLEQG